MHSALSCSSSPSHSTQYNAPGNYHSHLDTGEVGAFCTPPNTTIDDDQRLSAAIQADDAAHGTQAPFYPRSMPPNLSMSLSPAALFLSAFSPVAEVPVALPDDEGQVIAGYTLGGIVGYGATSTIRRAYSSSGGVVAVKIVRRSDLVKQGNAPLARKRLEHESVIWASLSHEHILPLFSAVHTPYGDYFITLLCPAGSLFDILKRDGRPALPQDDAGMMFRQVVRGLRYLHEVAMFVHRDMKLENVLVDEMGVCRIGDFGMTRKIGELDEEEDQVDVELQHDTTVTSQGAVHRSMTLGAPSLRRQARSSLQAAQHPTVTRYATTRHRNSTSSAQPTHPAHIFQPGSLPYASPELLLPQTSGVLRPHPSQDIWALGVMLYALLTGRLPFSDSFEPRLQMKILNSVYEVPEDIGRGAERVLKGCLERSVTSRWTIAQVDEVAWGVGWGAEGDDVTTAGFDGEEALECEKPSKAALTPHPRSRSRPPDITIPRGSDRKQDEMRSRPSQEAAERRSSSRAKRSLSRAPLSATSVRSTSRSASVSRSRRPPSPTFSTLNCAIMGSGTTSLSASIMSHSSSGSSSVPFKDSALAISPSPSLERGRRPKKNYHNQFSSRSPSPSVDPGTPVDLHSGGRFASPLGILADQPDDEVDLDATSRGRKKDGGRGIHSVLPGGHFYSPTADEQEDILETTAEWIGSSDSRGGKLRASSAGREMHARARIHHPRSPLSQALRQDGPLRRPGSLPPSAASPWASQHGAKVHSPQQYPRETFFGSFTTPTLALGFMRRSRSVDADYVRKADASSPLLIPPRLSEHQTGA